MSDVRAVLPLGGRPSPGRRVAVCLAGVARSARPNLKFMRAFRAGVDADVFFHLWETPDAERIVAALEPKAHVFEPPGVAPPTANPRRPERFTLECVPDPEVEASLYRIVGRVYEGPPRPGDPVVGRMVWVGFRAVRFIEERGLGIVVTRAVAFVRRRLDGERRRVRPKPIPAESARRMRI